MIFLPRHERFASLSGSDALGAPLVYSSVLQKTVIYRFAGIYRTFTENGELNLTMNLTELIDEAGANAGSLGLLAKKIGKHQTRLSEWKARIRRPDANEIAALAEIAHRPIFQTVAEIEAEIEPRFAMIWKKAVSELRQNQG